jgi:hypothetical protein
MKQRNTDKQIWTDKEFAERLEKIKAKRLIAGKPIKNMGELTREMLRMPAFDDLEKQLLDLDKAISKRIGIKFDGGLR